MNVKDISIKTQLITGFLALLAFVIVLGWMTYNQNERLQYQTEIIHNHPVAVQRAVGLLQNHVLSIQIDMKSFFIADNEREQTNALKRINVSREEAEEQLRIIESRYLGPAADVDSVFRALIEWDIVADETIRMFRLGHVGEAVNRTLADGEGGQQVNKLLQLINVIDNFARAKEQELYSASQELNRSLNIRMTGMLIAISIISLLIYFVLWKNIRQPLSAFTRATRRFSEGDLTARNAYTSKNEFGVLSASLNKLAEEIQNNIIVHERLSALSQLILNENEPRKFFKTVLNAFIKETGAQMAMAYLLDEGKNAFFHYESIGAGEQAKQSFRADIPEGEIGLAVTSGKIQHLKLASEDSRFLFYAAPGKIVPQEIITIPVMSGGKTMAVFSLCSLNPFSRESVQLMERFFDILNARVQGILAFRSIQHFSGKLEEQNRELEVQKFELTQQSAELVEQNAELERQKRQLDEASRFKTSFLSNMSHELRTPLNSVIALTGVLSRRLTGKIPDEEHSYLDVVERNGKHLLALINDILDLSRIESGREEININEFNACTVVEEVVNMVQPQAKQKEIELRKTCKPQCFPIFSDTAKIRHILINLVGNAIKFTERGSVEVTCSDKDNFLEIKVVDTGIGIEEKNLPYIFDEFKQADSSTSRKFGGTGLGLAIARKYAHMLGGHIKVKSTPGKGSEFTLLIPLQFNAGSGNSYEKKDALVEIPDESGSPEHEVSPVEKTILLVDDSEPAIIQMTDILNEYGFNVLVARGGEEALEIVGKTVPDAMVLDLMMPRMDGFQVLKILREAEPTAHVPVLILTAKHITKEELAFLKRNNVHQLIQKGDVSRNDLLKTIRDLVFPELKKPLASRMLLDKGKPLALVVEDNPDNMTTVKALLAEKYEVIEAVNGRQGVEMAKKHKPDFILMDIALPEVNGIEAFKIIRNDPQLNRIPVFALTASALTTDREIILAHGFDAYIPKPIEYKMFFETLEATLYGK